MQLVLVHNIATLNCGKYDHIPALVIAPLLKAIPKYQEAVWSFKGRGGRIYLDPGTYERLPLLSIDEYMMIVADFHPEVVMAPDRTDDASQHSAHATIDFANSPEWLEWKREILLKSSNSMIIEPHLMVVPHTYNASISEWSAAVEKLALGVTGRNWLLGIYRPVVLLDKATMPEEGLGRYAIAESFRAMCYRSLAHPHILALLRLRKVKVHFLGVSPQPCISSLLTLQDCYPEVASADTSLPLRMAMQNLWFIHRQGRDMYMHRKTPSTSTEEFLTWVPSKSQWAMIETNIKWLQLCLHHRPVRDKFNADCVT